MTLHKDFSSRRQGQEMVQSHKQIWLLVNAAVQALNNVVENTPGQGRIILEDQLEHRYCILFVIIE